MFKVNNEDTRKTSGVVLVSLLLTLPMYLTDGKWIYKHWNPLPDRLSVLILTGFYMMGTLVVKGLMATWLRVESLPKSLNKWKTGYFISSQPLTYLLKKTARKYNSEQLSCTIFPNNMTDAERATSAPNLCLWISFSRSGWNREMHPMAEWRLTGLPVPDLMD